MKSLIAANTIYQLIGRIATASVAIISTIFIARIAGVDVFGEYSIVITYVATFYVIADFGINPVLIKDFSKSEKYSQEHFSKVLAFRIVFGIIVAFFAALLLIFMPYSVAIKTAILMSLPLIFVQSVVRAPSTIFQSFLRYQYQTISVVIGSLLYFLLLLFLVYTQSVSLNELISIFVIGNITIMLIALFFVRSYIRFDVKWIDTKYWKYFVYAAFPIGIALLLNTLMIYADRWVLSILSTPFSVGIYFLAYKIFELLIVLPTFFMNAFYPTMVKRREKSIQKYNQMMKKSILYLGITAIIMTITILLFSNIVITSIWSAEMADASIVINILSLGLIAFFITSPLNWMILLEKKQKTLIYIYGFAFIFNLVLNYIFIPYYDFAAAAVITVLTEFLVLFMLIFVIKYKASKK